MKRIFVVLILVVMGDCSSAPQTSSQAAQTSQKALLPPDIVNYFNGDWAGKGKFTSGKDLNQTSVLSLISKVSVSSFVRKKDRRILSNLLPCGAWTLFPRTL
jgi:hypothetical protein